MADELETPPADIPTDRPAQNVMGEFNRKFGRIEQQVGAIAQAVSGLIEQRQAPAPAAPKGDPRNLSDDELWELAKSGDKAAFDQHQKRKAAETYHEMRGVESHQQLVDGQIGILYQKYPVLANPQHALTQDASRAYTLLVQRGYAPTKATQLEAMKTAIADRPDLVAEIHTQGARAREGARRVSAGNAGVMGASHRQDEPTPGSKIRVTAEQAALARRMNVKDPGGAMQRFMKRRETGESNFGAVGAMLQDGDW